MLLHSFVPVLLRSFKKSELLCGRRHGHFDSSIPSETEPFIVTIRSTLFLVGRVGYVLLLLLQQAKASRI